MFNPKTFNNSLSTNFSPEQTKAYGAACEQFQSLSTMIEKHIPGEVGQLAIANLVQTLSVIQYGITHNWKSTY